MAKIVYLRDAEAVPDRAKGDPGRTFVTFDSRLKRPVSERARGTITYRIRSDELSKWLPMIAKKADEEGHPIVYVIGARNVPRT